MSGLRVSIGGDRQEGKEFRTPAEREIRFEGGGPNWLHTMVIGETNQF